MSGSSRHARVFRVLALALILLPLLLALVLAAVMMARALL